MKILPINNSQSQKNQPNFQARNLKLHTPIREILFIPSELGRVHTDFDPLSGFYTVGVLKSIIRKFRHHDNFLFCRCITKNKEEAQAMHQRLLEAVQMAKSTDGPTIHLENDEFKILQNMRD